MQAHVQNVLRMRVCFLLLRTQFHSSRNFSSNGNANEKPILLVGQHDIAIIKESEKDDDLNDKEITRDQSIQYKLRDKVLCQYLNSFI
jgi:hypothetical protein